MAIVDKFGGFELHSTSTTEKIGEHIYGYADIKNNGAYVGFYRNNTLGECVKAVGDDPIIQRILDEWFKKYQENREFKLELERKTRREQYEKEQKQKVEDAYKALGL